MDLLTFERTTRNVNKQQKGSALHIILVAIALLAVIGALGYVVISKMSQSNETKTSTENNQQSQASTTATYTSSNGVVSVEYPKDWVAQEEPSPSTVESFKATSATLTSPNGTKVYVRVDGGGRGGACGPQETDVPFATGNKCGSGVLLSAEKLSTTGTVYTYAPRTSKPTQQNVFLVTQRSVTAENSDESLYTLFLTSTLPDEAPILNQPFMGLISTEGDPILNIGADGKKSEYIHAYASSPEKSFFDSSEGQTVKTILRSVKIKD